MCLCAFKKHTKANLSLLGKARLPVALTVLTSPSLGDEIVLCFCALKGHAQAGSPGSRDPDCWDA